MSGPALPPRPSAGEPLRATWGQQVVDYLRSLTPGLGNVGLRVSRAPGGTSYYAEPARPAGAATAAAVTSPWLPYLSPWQGTGDDPHASDRQMRFRLTRGKIGKRTPANMSVELLAFGDATDATITEAAAIITQVYAQTPVAEAVVGNGLMTVDPATLKVIQGADLVTALGSALPAFGSDGTLPAWTPVPICEVLYYGGALHFPPGASHYLEMVLNLSGTACGSAGRQIFAVPAS